MSIRLYVRLYVRLCFFLGVFEHLKERKVCIQVFHAPAQIITVPAQLITVSAQPPATGVAVCTALFSAFSLLIIILIIIIIITYGWADGQTDRSLYRYARAHLK